MSYFRTLLAPIIIMVTILVTVSASAETYQAGEYTINLEVDAKNGRTYESCDFRNNCIFLNHGTAWREKGYQGISWENRGYIYSVSWREGTSQLMYLKVFNPQGHLILIREMKLKGKSVL